MHNRKTSYFQLLPLNRFCAGVFLYYLLKMWDFSVLTICQNYMSEKDNNSIQNKLESFLFSRLLGVTFSHAMETGFIVCFSIQSLFLACKTECHLHIRIVLRMAHVVPIPLLPGTITSQVKLVPGILLLYLMPKIRNMGWSYAFYPQYYIFCWFFLGSAALLCHLYIIIYCFLPIHPIPSTLL